MNKFEYCAAIRTLGTAGEKYLQTLKSLQNQTIPPKKILVYIAEGYDLPKETIGIEQYIYVQKGMIAQRALPYTEIDTDYVLLLDDDLSFPPGMVEKLAREMKEYNGDIIAPNAYPHHKWSFAKKILYIFAAGTLPMKSDRWAFKIRSNACYSYNNNPKREVYETQSAAGACSLWKTEALKGVKFYEELYFNRFRYPLGEDQLLFYKAHVNGYKVLIDYNTGLVHLDGRSGANKANKGKEIQIGEIETLIWHRTIFSNYGLLSIISYIFKVLMKFSFKLITFPKWGIQPSFWYLKGVFNGIKLAKSFEYKELPPFRFSDRK